MQQSNKLFSESCAFISPDLTGESAAFMKFELLPLAMFTPPFKPLRISDDRASERSDVKDDLALPVSKNIAESMKK